VSFQRDENEEFNKEWQSKRSKNITKIAFRKYEKERKNGAVETPVLF